MIRTSQVVVVVRSLPVNTGDIKDVGLIPGSGRSLGGGHGNPLQYSCLENHHGQRSLMGYSPEGCKQSDTSNLAYKHKETLPRDAKRC